MWLTWLRVDILHDNSNGVKRQRSFKISHKYMSIVNKTSHSDKNHNDVANLAMKYSKTNCKKQT